jgi:hypothetical protein
MPKYALANDFWMGKLPRSLQNLSDGAWLLLALARPLIRRYNCSTLGKVNPGEADESIKGYVGNVAAFAQRDGGRVLTSLPPRPEDVVDRIVIAFVGSEADCKRAYISELGVCLSDFKAAYECLHAVNALYNRVQWDEEAARSMLGESEVLGLPSVLTGCVRVHESDAACARTCQSGPADAHIAGAEEPRGEACDSEPEEDAYNAGVADEDMKLDVDRQMTQVEVHLRKQALLAQQVQDYTSTILLFFLGGEGL